MKYLLNSSLSLLNAPHCEVPSEMPSEVLTQNTIGSVPFLTVPPTHPPLNNPITVTS